MLILEDPEALRGAARAARREGRRVGLVPTMGALHAGHLSLVRVARERAELVVMSLFVNPTQFGPGEDLVAYPRDFDGDRRQAEAAGVDILFAPGAGALYAAGEATRVEVERLGHLLCGASRPGHFRGVVTVVAKLMLLCEPHVAVFGRKDYQQFRILERMARDLFLEVEVVGAPTVREADGLALSSRNRYLSGEERRAALALPRALEAGSAAVAAGQRDPAAVVERMAQVLRAEPMARIDYLEAVDTVELRRIPVVRGEVLLAGAAFIGRTRLIDNRELRVA